MTNRGKYIARANTHYHIITHLIQGKLQKGCVR